MKSFSISIVFLLEVGVKFKPLLKTLTCVSVRHVLHKFMTLGWIIVCLFDLCELHPVREIKNYLRLRHLIVDLHLPLVYQVLLQFDFVVFLLFFSFLIGSITTTSKVVLFFCCFEGQLNFPKLCLFFLWLCWFLDSAGVGYSSPLSIFTCCFAAPWWVELLPLLLSLLFFISVSLLTILCSVIFIVLFTFLFRFFFFKVVTEFSGNVIKMPTPFCVKNVGWFLVFFSAIVFP